MGLNVTPPHCNRAHYGEKGSRCWGRRISGPATWVDSFRNWNLCFSAHIRPLHTFLAQWVPKAMQRALSNYWCTNSKAPHERKHLKWIAEASVLCKLKHEHTDLRKFDDLYGEKWKIRDCALARALDQNSYSVHESCKCRTKRVNFWFFWEKVANPFFRSILTTTCTASLKLL